MSVAELKAMTAKSVMAALCEAGRSAVLAELPEAPRLPEVPSAG